LRSLENKSYSECVPSGGSNGQVIRDELDRVLSSPGFLRSERLSRFLQFVVESHLGDPNADLKEWLIATEIYGRKRDYDPKQDSIVRTEAVRLRAKLLEYYSGAGATDPVVIEMPKGGYLPVFREAAAPRQRTPRTRVGVAIAVFATVIAAVTLGWWFRASRAPIPIAVLPLDNLTHDPANDYFADGLTDEIIRNLSILDGLEVRSRTSSFALKNEPRNMREAGRQLRADYILDGSVLRAGSHLRVDVQMVRVLDDVPVWSGRYDRALTDVFAIQDEISRGVVNELRLTLGRGRRRYETSIEAYDLYLRASALAIRRGIPGTVQSIEPLEQVIGKDPSFAPAYASLGRAYAIRSIQFAVDHPEDELSKMRAMTEQAIELDPLLAEAHDARALVYARQGQWDQSEKSFHRAIELNPNLSGTYADFAQWVLFVQGRKEEALRQLRIAEKSDPLSPDVQSGLALVLISTGRYDEASKHCLKMSSGGRCLARVLFAKGDTDGALRILRDHLSPDPESWGVLGYMQARLGHREQADRLLAAASQPNEQALIFAGLRDKDRALQALDHMAVLGPQRVGMYLNYPEFALLRGDPRVTALRKKVGLPE
jgi:TolB-like protein